MRRIKALITALAVFISVLSSVTFAQSSTTSGVFVISDFSEEGSCVKWSGSNMSEETIMVNGYEHKTALLERDNSNIYSQFNLSGTSLPTDWSGVGYVNLWIYSPEASNTSAFDILINTQDSENIGSYMRYAIKTDFVGWKLFSVSKDAFLPRDAYATWENVKSVIFAATGWVSELDIGAEVYIKGIWTTAEELGGEAQLVSRSHEDGMQNVEASDNVFSFELDEEIDEKMSTPIISTQVLSISGEKELLSSDEFDVSYSGETVYLSFEEELKNKKRYEISIGNIYTITGKEFSLQTTFSTVGYKPMYTDPTLFTISDFYQDGVSAKWSSTNMSEYNGSLGGYVGKTAKLETFYDPTKPSADQYKPYQTDFSLEANSLPTDWTNVDAVNMWVYSPQKSDTAKIDLLLLSNKGYFHCPISVDFEGWKLITLKKSEFSARNSGEVWNKIDKVTFVTFGWGAVAVPGTKLYFKEIWVTEASDGKLIQTSIKDGEMDVCVNETSLELVYDTYIYDVPYSINATLYKHNGESYTEVETLNTIVDKGKITIVGTNPYDRSTKYKIELKNLYLRNGNSVSKTVEFTTSGENVQAKRPVISENFSSDDVTVQTTVYNNLQTGINAGMTVRLLDKEGNLVKEKTSSVAEVGAGSGKNISVTVTDIYSLLDGETSYTIEAFIVNKTDGNKPILRHIGAYLDSTDSYIDTPFEQGEVSLNTSIQDKSLVISGAVSKGGIRPIVMTITNENLQEKLLIHTYTNSDGSYNLSYDVDYAIAESGWYDVTVAAYQAISTTDSTDRFYYADDTLKESIRTQINGSQTVSETATVINTYQAALGLKSDDYTNTQKYSNMTTTLFEQKQYQDECKYQSFGDIVSMLSLSEKTLSQLNDKEWTEIAAFATVNKQIVIAGTDFDSSFFAKTSPDKNAICEKVVAYKPFKTFSDFRTALTNSIDAYNKEQEELSIETTTKPSYGGGSGGSDRTFPTVPSVPQTDGKTEAFSDLDSFEWAEKDINMLLGKGVISQSSDKKFRPADAVKREEFVKMIVEALQIPLTGTESGFSDSSAGMWYEKYLSSAKSRGIVFGRENGSFGVGEIITREDMAVMINRAINAMGLSVVKNSGIQNFSDEHVISSYASDAVKEMQQAGFINGMGDGTFSPKGIATRAQAAVIISRVMAAFEKGAVN